MRTVRHPVYTKLGRGLTSRQLSFSILRDAVYAAVAQQAGCTLISHDHEHLTRLGSIVVVCTPTAVLADVVPPSSPSSPM
jgi:predicted nucleic acid-binding protein